MTSGPTPAATTPVDDGGTDDAIETTVAPATDPPSAASSQPSPPEGETPEEATPVRRRPRHRRWILVTVLLVLLAAAIASGTYLWRVADAWIERDGQWQGHSRELTSTLGAVSSDLEDTQAELDVVRGQLDQAQQRISELADEKAKLGDEHAVVRQLAEYQERVSTAAAAVVNALDSCIASQQRLIRWYAETEEPEPEDLEVYTDLNATLGEVCTAAQEAKEALQEELEG